MSYKQCIVKADSYDAGELLKAAQAVIGALNIGEGLKEDARVVIKPNLITGKDPAFAVTTHPALMRAVILCLREKGFTNITVADSPGGKSVLSEIDSIYHKTGMDTLADIAVLNHDLSQSEVSTPAGCKNKTFNIMNVIRDADLLINMPKLKTHTLTGISFGVKNLFGCIPGMAKPLMHAKYPGNADFSNMLVDLSLAVKPAFTIIDGIEAMEGDGPTGGERKHIGYIFASDDLYSQDRFVTSFCGIDPERIEMLKAERARSLTDTEPLFPLGGPYDGVTLRLPSTYTGRSGRKKDGPLSRLFYYNIPEQTDGCVLCGQCVRSCPRQAIKISGKTLTVDRDRCIRCFCCTEVCVHGGIHVVRHSKFRRKGKKNG